MCDVASSFGYVPKCIVRQLSPVASLWHHLSFFSSAKSLYFWLLVGRTLRMSLSSTLCSVCNQHVAIGIQCAVCDRWYHTSKTRPCAPLSEQSHVPFICEKCTDVLNLKSFKFGEAPPARGRGESAGLATGPSFANIEPSSSPLSTGLLRKQGSMPTMKKTASFGPIISWETITAQNKQDAQAGLAAQQTQSDFTVRSTPVSKRMSSSDEGAFSFRSDGLPPSPRSRQLALLSSQIEVLRKLSIKQRDADRLRTEYEEQRDLGDSEENADEDREASRRKIRRKSWNPGEWNPSSGDDDEDEDDEDELGFPDIDPEQLLQMTIGGDRNAEAEAWARHRNDLMSSRRADAEGSRAKKRVPLSQIDEAEPDIVTGDNDAMASLMAPEDDDVFQQRNLAERHRAVIRAHRRMYHRHGEIYSHLTAPVSTTRHPGSPAVNAVSSFPSGSSLSGNGGKAQPARPAVDGSSRVPARISVVEEVTLS